MHCIIIYQKDDGTKFIRAYNYDYGRKIGDKTAMGWKILNVLYEHEGNYYQNNKYMRIVRKNIEKQYNKSRIKKAIRKSLYNFISLNLKKLQEHMY